MNPIQLPKQRRNGLDRPWGVAQMGAWVTYIVSIVQYSIFVAPLLLPCSMSPILSIFFYLSIIYVFVHASNTILVNPIDLHLHHYRSIQEQQQSHDDDDDTNQPNGTTSTTKTAKNNASLYKPIIIRNPLYQPPMTTVTRTSTKKRTIKFSDRLYYRTNVKLLQLYNHDYQCHHHNKNNSTNNNNNNPHVLLPNEPMKQCWICDTTVAEHSMHCKFCNKCVYGFDHHCIWLNTCIGRANYISFFRTLQSLFAMELIHFISHLTLIILFFKADDEYEVRSRIRDVYPNVSIYFPLVVWMIFMVFNCMALVLLGQLYIFHTLLQKRNLTTYEHIVQDYRNQRNMARRLSDLEADRAEAIVRAQARKATCTVYRLQLGGYCRKIGLPYLDVLKLPPEPEEPDPEAGFANIFGANGGNNTGSSNIDNGIGQSRDSEDVYNNDSDVQVKHDYENNERRIESMDENDARNENYEVTDYDDDDDDDDDYHDENNKEDPTATDQSRHTTRSNMSRSNVNNTYSGQNDNDDDDDENPPPNYVELTMSGQNDYNKDHNSVIITDYGADHDYDDDDENDDNNMLDNSKNYDDDENYEENNNNSNEDIDEHHAVADGIFLDEPDDISYKSGCSGRSYRSGRSNRSTKSGRSTRLPNGERDLTRF